MTAPDAEIITAADDPVESVNGFGAVAPERPGGRAPRAAARGRVRRWLPARADREAPCLLTATETACSDVDAPLGDIVNRISLNASALVREEIELAKAEMELKVKSSCGARPWAPLPGSSCSSG